MGLDYAKKITRFLIPRGPSFKTLKRRNMHTPSQLLITNNQFMLKKTYFCQPQILHQNYHTQVPRKISENLNQKMEMDILSVLHKNTLL